jgi:histidinol dehydrogenase
MGGHVADLDAVTGICARHRLTLVEDCAHTLGATWNGRATGTWGEFGCFSYGDKAAGLNHSLPTKGAARHTGGLWVGKFLKTLTWQEMTRVANREVGTAASRLSRVEGMEGHARAGDARLGKYLPHERFDTAAPT